MTFVQIEKQKQKSYLTINETFKLDAILLVYYYVYLIDTRKRSFQSTLKHFV